MFHSCMRAHGSDLVEADWEENRQRAAKKGRKLEDNIIVLNLLKVSSFFLVIAFPQIVPLLRNL